MPSLRNAQQPRRLPVSRMRAASARADVGGVAGYVGGTLSPAAIMVFVSKSLAFLDDSSISRSFSYPKNLITSFKRKQGPEDLGRLSSSNTIRRLSSDATINMG